jgi:hypothetical protein
MANKYDLKVSWYTDIDGGGVKCESWYKNGLLDNDGDLPALVCYYRNGNKRCEEWFKEGKPHREDGPAFISYDMYKTTLGENWYLNGLRHRLDGPCVVNGGEGMAYSIHGEGMSEEMFLLKTIKTRNDAILNIRHKSMAVRLKCKSILDIS